MEYYKQVKLAMLNAIIQFVYIVNIILYKDAIHSNKDGAKLHNAVTST